MPDKIRRTYTKYSQDGYYSYMHIECTKYTDGNQRIKFHVSINRMKKKGELKDIHVTAEIYQINTRSQVTRFANIKLGKVWFTKGPQGAVWTFSKNGIKSGPHSKIYTDPAANINVGTQNIIAKTSPQLYDFYINIKLKSYTWLDLN